MRRFYKTIISCGVISVLLSCVYGQASGYWVLENVPLTNRLNKVSALTLIEFRVDSASNPVGAGKKYSVIEYDQEGFKTAETFFDSLGKIRCTTIYSGIHITEYMDYLYSGYWKIVRLNGQGQEVNVMEGSISETGDSVFVSDSYFFKPCYYDYIYEYSPTRLIKSAVKVIPREGFIMSDDGVPETYYEFRYEYWKDSTE